MSKTNGDDEAFPVSTNVYATGWSGLTKRECFAAMAMQGIYSNGDAVAIILNAQKTDNDAAARIAVNAADALIKALNETEGSKP